MVRSVQLPVRRVLVATAAKGSVLSLDEPLSLWGGLNPRSGEITDRRHPQSGLIGSHQVWCMRHGRGSSSASSILLEAVRLDTAPSAIVLCEEDGILALGAAVAKELYGRCPAVLILDDEPHRQLAEAERAEISESGEVTAYFPAVSG